MKILNDEQLWEIKTIGSKRSLTIHQDNQQIELDNVVSVITLLSFDANVSTLSIGATVRRDRLQKDGHKVYIDGIELQANIPVATYLWEVCYLLLQPTMRSMEQINIPEGSLQRIRTQPIKQNSQSFKVIDDVPEVSEGNLRQNITHWYSQLRSQNPNLHETRMATDSTVFSQQTEIGDITCQYNARSSVLRCAVNPSGPCENCQHYQHIPYANLLIFKD